MALIQLTDTGRELLSTEITQRKQTLDQVFQMLEISTSREGFIDSTVAVEAAETVANVSELFYRNALSVMLDEFAMQAESTISSEQTEYLRNRAELETLLEQMEEDLVSIRELLADQVDAKAKINGFLREGPLPSEQVEVLTNQPEILEPEPFTIDAPSENNIPIFENIYPQALDQQAYYLARESGNTVLDRSNFTKEYLIWLATNLTSWTPDLIKVLEEDYGWDNTQVKYVNVSSDVTFGESLGHTELSQPTSITLTGPQPMAVVSQTTTPGPSTSGGGG